MFCGPASGDWAGASAWAKSSESTADSFEKAGRSNRLRAPASTREAAGFVQLAQRIQHDVLSVPGRERLRDLRGGGAQGGESAARLPPGEPEDRRPGVGRPPPRRRGPEHPAAPAEAEQGAPTAAPGW